jgi:tRNA dimethylallyltransferase
MKKVLVIAGPTASGKSDFAVEMAERLDAEIISGDSIQVYRGCDIGSGKVTEEEKHGIPHHLIDILSPKESYSAADFQRMARSFIDSSPKLQIICGGTGLYLKSCLYDYSFSNEREAEGTDPALEKLDNDTLYAMLKERDPVQAEKIHPHNRRRILRSLTIYERSGKPQSELEAGQNHEMIYDAFIAGCTMERSVLYERINHRVEGMFEKGLEAEVERLLSEGVTFEDSCMHGIGYQEFAPYFAKTCTIEDVKQEIQKHSRQFAKRQYTWFRHQMPVHWFNPQNREERQAMEEEILRWIRED